MMLNKLPVSPIKVQPLPPYLVKEFSNEICKPDAILTEKKDGQRFTVVIPKEGEPKAYSKNGGELEIPQRIGEALDLFPDGPWMFDGELCDDGYHIFDILMQPRTGMKFENFPYVSRHALLEQLCRSWGVDCVKPVRIARTLEEKKLLIVKIRVVNGEGFVLSYNHEKIGSRRLGYKWKFTLDLDLIVLDSVPDKEDTYELGAYQPSGEGPFSIGRCSLPSLDPQSITSHITVVEVNVDGFTDEGTIKNPVFKRVRRDKSAYSCTVPISRMNELDSTLVDAVVNDITYGPAEVMNHLLQVSENEYTIYQS